MREVRVKVKLSNGADQMLADAGSLDRVRVRSCVVEAMVDTGAVRSVIPESVARQPGLPSGRMRTVALADGRTQSVPLAGPLVFDLDGRDTFDDAFILGDECCWDKRCWKKWICSWIARASNWCRLILKDPLTSSSSYS